MSKPAHDENAPRKSAVALGMTQFFLFIDAIFCYNLSMTDFETLKNTIHSDIQKMVELETLLSSIPAIAPESGGEGELKKCETLEKYLKALGFSNFMRFDAKDSRVPNGTRPNLVVTIPGKSDDFSIWVMAHLDVVPPGDLKLWKSDPWKVVEKDGKLIGRGVEDNQQGLVSGVFAAKALIDSKIAPEHTVKLLFMADEEFGSEFGIKFLLREHRNLFRKEDLILIPDGGDPNGETIEVAEKNILWLRLRTVGEQSHGSMPDKGKNAHLAAADLALRLNGLESVFDGKDEMFSPPFSTFQAGGECRNREHNPGRRCLLYGLPNSAALHANASSGKS